MSRGSKGKRRAVRFLLSIKRYEELQNEARKLDIPLSSYLKIKLEGKDV